MAALETTSATMIDWAKRLDKDGKTAEIVEMLSQDNEIMDDMIMIQCNEGQSHRTTLRTSLNTGTFRRWYQGVAPTRTTTAQVVESCANLEDYTEIDVDEADANGNTDSYRLSENEGKMQGLSQQMASTLFYGNADVNPDRYTGFAPRFGVKTGASNADNILLAGGASNCTSIWLIGWGEQTCHTLFPQGSAAGLQHNNMGKQLIQKSDGTRYQAYVDHYKWQMGLCVKDWRHVVRIANIDVTALTADASSGADLFDLLAQALEILKSTNGVRIYGNRRISSFLRRQRAKSQNVQITMDEVGGKRVMAVDGIPFRRVDALLNTESAVA